MTETVSLSKFATYTSSPSTVTHRGHTQTVIVSVTVFVSEFMTETVPLPVGAAPYDPDP
jgi:hypothetical protein